MQHRRPFTFVATMVHCWFVFNKVSTGTPRSFSTKMLSRVASSCKSHLRNERGTAIPAEANSMPFPPWSTEKLTALRIRNKLHWLYNFPNYLFNFSADLVLPPQNITKAGRRTGKLGRGNNGCQLDVDRNIGYWCGLHCGGHTCIWYCGKFWQDFLPEPLKTVKSRNPNHSQAIETSDALYAIFIFHKILNIH